MDHDGLMTGMLVGGALVALVPTLLVVGIGVYALRQHRASQRSQEDAAQTREVAP